MNEFLITLENRPGSLAECCVAIGNAGINILGGAGLGTSVAAAALVTAEADETAAVLDSLGMKYAMSDLHTTLLEDVPGALGAFTAVLAEQGVNLRSIYILGTGNEGVQIGYSTD